MATKEYPCRSDVCDHVSKSGQGRASHERANHPNEKLAPYKDEEKLRELYLDRNMSTVDIAEVFNCGKGTIQNWLRNYKIPIRNPSEAKIKSALKDPPYIGTNENGYLICHHEHRGEDYQFVIHRLIMVAEHGFKSLYGKSVHHKNEIPWDNRPGNLKLMESKEHKSHHNNGVYYKTKSKITKEQCEKITTTYGQKTQEELADEFNVSGATIHYHATGECLH